MFTRILAGTRQNIRDSSREVKPLAIILRLGLVKYLYNRAWKPLPDFGPATATMIIDKHLQSINDAIFLLEIVKI